MTAEAEKLERTVVKTYVPRYQKERWREAADSMEMSLSEFVRTMVQAGRRGFDLGPEEGDRREPGPPPSSPGGDGLETRLLDVLSADRFRTWDELVEALAENFEDELESTLQELTGEGRIVHSPRRGGYALAEGPDE